METSLGIRIRLARVRQGLSQKELGRKIRRSATTVSRWERGVRTLKYAEVQRIADALNLPIGELIPAKPEGESNAVPGSVRSVVLAPVVGKIPGGEPLRCYPCLLENFVAISDVGDDEVFGVDIEGDSMEPVIRDGEQVVISPRAEVRSGDIALVRIGDEYTLKRVQFQNHNHTVILQPLNPRYDVLILERDTEARIEGKAVWAGRRLG